ncbi:hypothetical protein [Legionella septentrionalis]|uniref:hypothetical protein n=1 Tax=Legionella septentrionalis TaxID=2498109 RepID=UPI000F8DE72E|nr:hypothetical protein [Legionella septentrionalis]RUR09422.1 hypothetical protein ELY14_08740 [Legionella septentrionalis]
MPVFLFPEENITVENYTKFCLEKKQNPKRCVFVFLDDSNQNPAKHTLFSIKKGNDDLGKIAQTLGEAGFATLGLPASPDGEDEEDYSEVAMAAVWRAAGAGYTIIFPARIHCSKGDIFAEHLGRLDNTSGTEYELNFWDKKESSNEILADYYLSLVPKLVSFTTMRDNQDRNLEQKLGEFATEDKELDAESEDEYYQNAILKDAFLHGKNSPQDKWLQPPAAWFSPSLLLAIGSGIFGAAGAATVVIGALALAKVITILCPPLILVAAGAAALTIGIAGIGFFAHKHTQARNQPLQFEQASAPAM